MNTGCVGINQTTAVKHVSVFTHTIITRVLTSEDFIGKVMVSFPRGDGKHRSDITNMK